MGSRRSLWPIALLLLIGASVFLQQNRALLTVRSTAVNILAPLQETLSGISSASNGLFGSFREAQAVDQDNQKLRRMVDELRRENVELWDMVARQQKSIEEMGFQKANPRWSYLSARVVAWDPSSIVRTVVIDKGKLDGVGPGMVVVSSSGLVGKVLELADRWAKVLLITDPRSSVNGVLQGSEDRTKGVLQGRPDGLLQMRYLLAESKVQKGDVVVTSGLGGVFPSGLFIGWVMEASYSDGQMFHEVLVRPAAGLSDLADLMVVTNFTPLRLE